MKSAMFASAAMLLVLAGCSKGSDTQESSGGIMSANEFAEKLNNVKLQSGEWEAVQEIADVRVDGVPPGVSPDAFTRLIGQRSTVRYCLTPEQANNPSADFLAAQEDSTCSYSSMDMKNGMIKASMSCDVPNQKSGKMRILMDGTYSADSYDLDMNVDTTDLPNNLKMTMKIKATGKYLGACQADDAKEGGNSSAAQ